MKGSKRQRAGNVEAQASDEPAAAATGSAEQRQDLARGMVDYINISWTPYHAVEEASRRLLEAGFQHISERGAWEIKAGGKYFFTRNMSTIVAFAVGEKWAPGNGFNMIGAHTDSPCLKLRPVTKNTKSGYLLVNVETYGGGLWYTWYDRDLGLAGRVLMRSGEALQHRLVKIDRPILRIPMLAIHLQRDIHTAGFKPNLQTNFSPILATTVKAQLDKPAADAAASSSTSAAVKSTDTANKHHTVLMELLAKELGSKPEDIVEFELNLCDVQPATIGGIQDEFVYAGRLDNLAMSYISLQALIDSCKEADSLKEETGVRAVALFDHEEVGSDSAQGAGGPVMRDTIKRVAAALSNGEEGAVERTLVSSFLVSADMAHALHPNYTDRHEPDHQPKFHGGLVVKYNANQRYSTNAVSAGLFSELARRKGLPCQEFSARNDMACGSTIGPILSSNLGCRTVDVGIPQLSMHSIREMCGTDDVAIAYNHFLAFYEEFSKLDKLLDVDSLPPPNIIGKLRDPPCHHIH
eukprot:CAMPEP_0202920920 /NCGR_PEP_ID=MMETSP1392-20130828/77107_1 /ASSEMBLY_ACC=CAM_ASM_000868 /TAXON_ID=225041 /ORGANISM="Chlamydomonas chlamydogama, Strain SAG 11-48b" /LENGTH=522 /DNA_ID=CAMNT_0049614441 /DNA_START=192 /DNA_END=1760 /DNA_ORIENTATION=-